MDSNQHEIVMNNDIKNAECHGQYDFLKLWLFFWEKKKKKMFRKKKAENRTTVFNFKKIFEPETGASLEGIGSDIRASP